MNGFLSNTWRDTLAVVGVVGVALSCIQCLSLLRAWATRKTDRQPWFRLGILEAYRDNEDVAPLDVEMRRILWIALGSSVLIMALGAVFIHKEIILGLLLPLMFASAIIQEVFLIVFIFRRFPALMARGNEWLVAPVLSLIYIGLLFLAYWGISLDKGAPLDEPSSPWWHGAVTLYANCYFLLAIIFCVGEVVTDVARWREKRTASTESHKRTKTP